MSLKITDLVKSFSSGEGLRMRLPETQKRRLFIFIPIIFAPALKHHKLLEPYPSLKQSEVSFKVSSLRMEVVYWSMRDFSFLFLLFLLCFFRRIIEHCGAHTILAFLTHQYIIVHAALASFPELVIDCQFRIGHRFVSQIRIDFHYCQPCGESEDLGIRVFFSRKSKHLLFDLLGHTALAESRSHNQSAVGHKLFVLPGFDVAEAHPLTGISQSNHGLTFFNFH